MNKKIIRIKEDLDFDFYVDPKPLTEAERKLISDYIKADKDKRKKLKTIKKGKTSVEFSI